MQRFERTKSRLATLLDLGFFQATTATTGLRAVSS